MKSSHKIFFAAALFLTLISWFLSICFWDKLPETIPIHFGISGQADDWAQKSLFSVFLIPGLQAMMLVLFTFLYYKPQYSSMPTTMYLMTLDKKHRNEAFALIRIMLVGTVFWINLLFTYITYGMNAAAFDSDLGLSPTVMFTLVGLMFAWLAYWSIKTYSMTKNVLTSNKR